MFSRPQVSIIIPVYNMQDELPKCLESVVCQTFTDYEVLVINDGSTDNTAQIIQNFKEQHPHFMCLTQPNQGVAAARNAGLLRAEGTYVCFLDGDDFLEPHFLQRMVSAAQKTGAEVCLCPRPVYEMPSGKIITEKFTCPPAMVGAEKAAAFESFQAVMSVCGKLVRREWLQKNNICFPLQAVAEDILPSVQMLAHAPKTAFVADTASYYCVGGKNALSSRVQGKFTALFTAFMQAQKCLVSAGLYAACARGFENVRLTCLLSHISAFSLTAEEWQLAVENRAELLAVPLGLLRGRAAVLKVQFFLLKLCLRCGVSYPRVWAKIARLKKSACGKRV